MKLNNLLEKTKDSYHIGDSEVSEKVKKIIKTKEEAVELLGEALDRLFDIYLQLSDENFQASDVGFILKEAPDKDWIQAKFEEYDG